MRATAAGSRATVGHQAVSKASTCSALRSGTSRYHGDHGFDDHGGGESSANDRGGRGDVNIDGLRGSPLIPVFSSNDTQSPIRPSLRPRSTYPVDVKECHVAPPSLLSIIDPLSNSVCPARNPVVEVENDSIVGGIKKSGVVGPMGMSWDVQRPR